MAKTRVLSFIAPIYSIILFIVGSSVMNRHSAGNERSLLVNHPNITQRRKTTSSTKLSQLFGKESENERLNSLLNGLDELSIASRLITKTAEAQRRGTDQLARWAHKSKNAAIDDVMQKTNQIFHMYADKQAQFARDYEHFLMQLRKIIESEKMVKECEAEVKILSEKEKKIKKELQKGGKKMVKECEAEVKILSEKEKKIKKELQKGGSLFSKKKNSDILILKEQLDRTMLDKQLCERKLQETRAEAEVIKMFRFRHGMMGIADSYRNLATNTQAMFDCHREITEMVPAISTQDVNTMFYEGIPVTRERMENLRRSLDSELPIVYNPPSARRSEPIRSYRNENYGNNNMGTPPPPYTPTAPLQTEFNDSRIIQRIDETPRRLPQRRRYEINSNIITCNPGGLSSSSSSDESSPSNIPQPRLYPSLDEPDSCPLKNYGLINRPAYDSCPLKNYGLINRPAYGVH
uniref:Uncharacterized protein n=2 Tax=Panagrolaimus sp. JU765 TaxID=591449 RepID=A0AC34R8P3_9BILA